MIATLRKTVRWIQLVLLILIGSLFTVFFLRKTISPHGFTSKVITTWLGIVAYSLGVRIKNYGTPLTEKTLFVANHISWLDILVLGNLTPIHFLAKEEVKHMPIVGWLATKAGTLYIKRGNRTSATESNSEITAILKQHHNSLVFAEGTTTDGHIRKFHSRMLQSAIDAQAMVQPVAIFYPAFNKEKQKNELNPVVLFIGNTTIGESADLVFRARTINVEVHYLKPINSVGKTRDEIAKHAFNEVVDAIESIKS